MNPWRDWIGCWRRGGWAALCLGVWLPGHGLSEEVDLWGHAEIEMTGFRSSVAGTGNHGQERARRDRPREVIQVGGVVNVGEDEHARDVIAIFGDVNVQGTVEGDLVVLLGRAAVDGEVRGSVVTVMSSLRLGSASRIGRDLVAVLGSLTMAPGVTVGGQQIDLSLTLLEGTLEQHFPPMDGIRVWSREGLLKARLVPHQPGWWWWYVLACAGLYFLMAVIFRRPVAASVEALRRSPLLALVLGLVLFVLLGPMLLMLVATGIGVVVVPFVVASVLVAFLFGKIAVYQYLGRELGTQLGLKVLTIPLVALLVGMGFFVLVYMVPVLGLLAWSLTALLGVGAVLMACFAGFRPPAAPGDPLAPNDLVGAKGTLGQLAAGSMPVLPPESGSRMLSSAVATRVAVETVPAPNAPGPVESESPPRIPGQVPVLESIEVATLARAGFWVRLGATLIDLVLIGVVVAVLQRGAWFIPLWFVYHVGMWAWRGTTIGGIVFGLKVVRQDGRSIDFPVALVRSLSSVLSVLVLFLGFLWVAWTRKKRAWHDLIAGTMIVRMPKGLPMV